LAVGGLFDFYSGDIARAPLSFRQLGLEWVWRLVQEPKTKFHRYIVGNPLFLIRVYILGLATKGEQ
jgi:N-acetylglucosaminyldiphosphoundecaprenol N-acetyl-beta-D-mannosaminyltransferase